jgi:hypothetical protein
MKQDLKEWFTFESKMVYNCTNDAFGEFRLLKLSQTKEIPSQDDCVTGVTSELEAAGNSIGNGTLPRPSMTKEPKHAWTVR